MKTTTRYIVLGLVIVAAFWGCLAIAIIGLGRFLNSKPVTPQQNTQVTPTAIPNATVDQQSPSAVEQETAKLAVGDQMPERDLVELAHRLGKLAADVNPTPPPPSPPHQVGDALTFWVNNQETNSYFTATATLSYATPHAYWWIQRGYNVPGADVEQSALNFEDKTYPTDRRIFGSEWSPGIDGDVHVYIFLGNVPGVGGYYSPPDEYPVAINPHSNQHEMFYINLENALPGNSYFDGVLAHEFQHMIHWNEDRDEDTWVNEGLSELAAHVNGYTVDGAPQEFSRQPDTQLTAWSELDQAAPHYGASYLFMDYVHEQYGDDAIKKLVAEPANGIAGIDAMLATVDPKGRRFAEVYADWIVANYLDQAKLDTGRYGYTTLTVDQLTPSATYSRYPAGQQQAAVHLYGTDYIVLEGKGNLSVDFTGSTLVPLVGDNTHSGRYQWWSNRGDDKDARLTRAFDLIAVKQATLKAWMWYELEKDYDYAYVEVSADAGKTWTLLSNSYMTTTNPSGNSYGAGLTGKSGGGAEPVWVQQSFDLTPYAGRPVLVRFEVITDEELNYRGLCVDDVSVPELGYQDDVENGAESWQAEGFIRIGDLMPEQFLVQVVLAGPSTRIERMALDAGQHGTLSIAGLGSDVSRAVLVVTAMAPVSTEWTSYQYQITPGP